MISHQQLVAKIRECNYQFDTASRRAQTYRQKGGVKRITFNERDWHDDNVVCGLLRQVGVEYNVANAWVGLISKENAASDKSAKKLPRS